MPCILYEDTITPREEVEVFSKYFPAHDHVVGIQNDLVIPRYCVLPYYRTLEKALAAQGSRLINSYSEHQYIANFEYYFDIQEFTPKSWLSLVEVPKNGGPFVVKGMTNSRKFDWNKAMYAESFSDVMRITSLLQADSMIGQQEIVVREFVPLKVLEIGINDLPFSNEWRFFFLGEDLLSYGFYWSISAEMGTISEEGIAFARQIASIIKNRVNFFVIDIAEKKEGGWTVIEVNYGQMSGLSLNEPDTLYSNLRLSLERA